MADGFSRSAVIAIVHRHREAVAAPCNGGNRTGAEHRAQRRDLRMQIVLADGTTVPCQAQQLLLGNDPVPALDQRQQHVERTFAQRGGPPIDEQQAFVGVDFMATEAMHPGQATLLEPVVGPLEFNPEARCQNV
ncbi:hypothetical protein [Piscinibacter sp. XHJ-5]|uniref:hypothetical protein n=1 Tax=Piscinibacter sp. XHJ-5 TaxID=3037797 RepID=UPI0024534425|nr:hypothetical protein [Piscinibacter sp. XHJ-5]